MSVSPDASPDAPLDPFRGLPSVIAAVDLIDEQLRSLPARQFVAAQDVIDMLLDLRAALAFEAIPMAPA